MSTRETTSRSSATERFYRDSVHGKYYQPRNIESVPGRYREIIKILSGRPGIGRCRILEVGSETPVIVRAWSSQLGVSQENVFCVDVSSPVVELLQDAKFQTQQRDVSSEAMPFADGFFDCIIASEVLEHLQDADHAMVEFRRLLGPSGDLILTTPNLAAWFNRIQLFFGYQPIFTETGTQHVFGRGQWVPSARPVGHLQVYTGRALREFVEYHGFKVIRMKGLALEPRFVPTPALRRLDRFFSGMPSLASGLLVHAAPATSGQAVGPT